MPGQIGTTTSLAPGFKPTDLEFCQNCCYIIDNGIVPLDEETPVCECKVCEGCDQRIEDVNDHNLCFDCEKQEEEEEEEEEEDNLKDTDEEDELSVEVRKGVRRLSSSAMITPPRIRKTVLPDGRVCCSPALECLPGSGNEPTGGPLHFCNGCMCYADQVTSNFSGDFVSSFCRVCTKRMDEEKVKLEIEQENAELVAKWGRGLCAVYMEKGVCACAHRDIHRHPTVSVRRNEESGKTEAKLSRYIQSWVDILCKTLRCWFDRDRSTTVHHKLSVTEMIEALHRYGVLSNQMLVISAGYVLHLAPGAALCDVVICSNCTNVVDRGALVLPIGFEQICICKVCVQCQKRFDKLCVNNQYCVTCFGFYGKGQSYSANQTPDQQVAQSNAPNPKGQSYSANQTPDQQVAQSNALTPTPIKRKSCSIDTGIQPEDGFTTPERKGVIKKARE